MNDPHVTALHYWVEHDESVDYEGASPFKYENESLQVCVKDKHVTIRPKEHYASEEEALEAVDIFVRNWEFDAAIDSGSSRFSLTYAGADRCDRDPAPTPPGVIPLAGHLRSGPVRMRARLRVGRKSYPSPSSGPMLNVDSNVVQAMLYRLEKHLRGIEPLASMAYFCLTALEDSAPKGKDKTSKDKRTRDHYGISVGVLNQVSRLSSEKGGSEARKGIGLGDDFTKEEKSFLVAAVRAFIRRVAEKETFTKKCLPEVTLADLPSVTKQKELP